MGKFNFELSVEELRKKYKVQEQQISEACDELDQVTGECQRLAIARVNAKSALRETEAAFVSSTAKQVAISELIVRSRSERNEVARLIVEKHEWPEDA